jgi:hypothetical protein
MVVGEFALGTGALPFEITSCPAVSTTTGTLSISGNVITAATPSGNVPYRIAAIVGVIVAARGSSVAPGFMAVGVRQ